MYSNRYFIKRPRAPPQGALRQHLAPASWKRVCRRYARLWLRLRAHPQHRNRVHAHVRGGIAQHEIEVQNARAPGGHTRRRARGTGASAQLCASGATHLCAWRLVRDPRGAPLGSESRGRLRAAPLRHSSVLFEASMRAHLIRGELLASGCGSCFHVRNCNRTRSARTSKAPALKAEYAGAREERRGSGGLHN